MMLWNDLNNYPFLVLVVMAYFLGSIPFSVLVSKLKGIDLRRVGSGNIGATNVYRAMGLPWAIVVFILDGAKGWIMTVLAVIICVDPIAHVVVGFMAIIGHSLSVFVRFKGGKGVATGLGVLMGLNILVFSIVFLIGVSFILLTRYVAPVSIFCSVLTPVLLYAVGAPLIYVGVFCIVSVFIVIRHYPNIKRLLRGKEHKI